MSNQNPKSKSPLQWPWVLALVLSPVIAILYYSGMVALFELPDDIGKAGDLFGGLTAISTAMAFIGLLWTVHLQRHDIEIQREELQLSREIQKDQIKVFEAQRDLQRLQVFEATFFNLLASFDRIVDSSSIPGGGAGMGEKS